MEGSNISQYERNPQHIRDYAKEWENDTCKILIKEKPSKITISRLTEAGFFVPIDIFDISEYVARSSFESELFEVEIE